jgi:hypothetical protein
MTVKNTADGWLEMQNRPGICRAGALFIKALPQADGSLCHLPFTGPLVGLIYQPLVGCLNLC